MECVAVERTYSKRGKLKKRLLVKNFKFNFDDKLNSGESRWIANCRAPIYTIVNSQFLLSVIN